MLFMHFFVYSLSLIFPFFSSALYEIRCKYDYFYSNCKEKIDFFSLFFFKACLRIAFSVMLSGAKHLLNTTVTAGDSTQRSEGQKK